MGMENIAFSRLVHGMTVQLSNQDSRESIIKS
jgi:hypothetical protein